MLTVTTAFRAAPAVAIGVFACTAAGAVLAPVGSLLLKHLTDAVVTGRAGAIVVVAAALAGVDWAAFVLNKYGVMVLRMDLDERTRLFIERHILRLVASVPTLDLHERPEYANEIALLRTSQGALAQPVGPVVFVLRLLVVGSTTLTLLAGVHPLLLLLPVFTLPSLALTGLSARITRRAAERTVERSRSAASVFALATAPASAKEARIYGLGPELLRREGELQGQVLAETTHAAITSTAVAVLGLLLFAVGYLGALGFVAYLALHGRATAGDVVLTLNLATTVNGLVSAAGPQLSWLARTMHVAARYRWLIDYARTAESHDANLLPVPQTLRHGIDLVDVAFRYPGNGTDVLSGVDLHLPAGSTVAIVGDNGAGKSTLIKLLCRFYEPTSGRILIEGTDLRRMSPSAWRQRTTAAFQDFAKMELLAGETIGLGDLPHLGDGERVIDAAARAGAEQIVAALPRGIRTQLGRQFEGGVDLSGGEWQKLALARSLMREDPLLIVLDEPAASLDAHAEHALFERYADAARVSAQRGAITVLVSHRFSTVQMADLIVVVEGGRVSQFGTHADLLTTGGTYADLYATQARAYR